jgi:N-sulfoglucosamine sulfohydrolase
MHQVMSSSFYLAFVGVDRVRKSRLFAALAVMLITGLLCLPTQASEAGSLPNILWITSEDNAAQWLGCYGNKEAKTPRLDALAAHSLLFAHAYSNAAVCAVARSTILNGAYAVTQGTQHMRSRYKIPAIFKPYVTYLREQGYFCTNNSKTDYNFAGDDRKIWDECSKRADYKHRAPGQPFFAVFNLLVSHESSLFPQVVQANRRKGIIPNTPRLDPHSLLLPPYVPDLPEMRNDFAIYYDNISAMDRQVGKLLDQLKRRGEADNTIVFYYSDHGGPTPRGKRYLTDTGVRVPLVIHIPEKWRHLSPFRMGSQVDEVVSFVDLAPTVLSLCGLEKPPQMQGRAFLGAHRVAPPKNADAFLFADRFDEINGMRRGITDGRFKYIRRFSSHLPAAPYSYYTLSMPSWRAWQKAWQDGRLSGSYRDLWEPRQPVEDLFDTKVDPWEIHNLASDPRFADRLVAMRNNLRSIMANVHDTGLVPEAMFGTAANGPTTYDYVHSSRFDQEKILKLAFQASARDVAHLSALIKAMDARDPIARYWGATGCAILGTQAASAANKLSELLSDSQPTVRMAAACALYEVGRPNEAKQSLLAEFNSQLDGPESIQLINAITEVKALDQVPKSWMNKIRADANANEYAKRFAKRLAK